MHGDAFDFPPPTPSDLGDHEVPRDGDRLEGVRVALLVTGGIAAFRAPILARALRRQGAIVTAFATTEALRYVAREALAWACDRPVVVELTADAEHLSDSAPFDLYLVAPATYSVIGKCAHGIADTPVTATLASAIGRMERGHAAVVLAPTMHGSMHTSILVSNLRTLASVGCTIVPPRDAYGKHNLPEEPVLVDACAAALQAVSLRPQ
ncbi:MAG: phosphopantothenate--cysteine ligase family flavoprotein [Phycisphaerales bacterium]|nr:phosphopantothenate--cysteine ligase family flavoprotein [Phycisphaerales bacterium]